MDQWVKDLIRSGGFCYLSYFNSNGSLLTHKNVYSYEKGFLIIPLSIIVNNILTDLNNNPKVSMYLKNGKKSVIIQGQATIDQTDLDKGWLKYQKSLKSIYPDYFKIETGKLELPFLWKQALIKIKPKTIIVVLESGEKTRYELEILS